MEYGLNKTGKKKKAAKVCELMWVLIWFCMLLISIVPANGRLFAPSQLYIVCKCAGAFVTEAGRTVTAGVALASVNVNSILLSLTGHSFICCAGGKVFSGSSGIQGS